MAKTTQFTLIAKRIISALQLLIHKYVESVQKYRESQQDKSQQQPPPTVVHATLELPIEVSEYCKSHAQEKPAAKVWRWIKNALEVGAVASAIVLVYFTNRTLKQVKRQADAAQGQLTIMQAGQRPWLGNIGKIRLVGIPTLGVQPISPPNKTGITVSVKGSVGVHNFGTSPAFAEHTSFFPYLATAEDEAIFRPSASAINCIPVDTRVSSGEVIFPGVTVNSGFGVQGSTYLVGKSFSIEAVWVIGCFNYEDTEKRTHHTKFWLRSIPAEDVGWIQLTPGIRYRPIAGFQLWGEEAD